jgi:hypothetical protein
MTRSISVELGDGAKKFEKVLPVLRIQCCDKASVDEDELREIAIVMERSELVLPSDGGR